MKLVREGADMVGCQWELDKNEEGNGLSSESSLRVICTTLATAELIPVSIFSTT